MDVICSVNGVPIRLTSERWYHIISAREELVDRHEEVINVVENPDWVTMGYRGSLIAWKGYGRKGFLAVVYKELGLYDGFIITAFFTTKAVKKRKIWP